VQNLKCLIADPEFPFLKQERRLKIQESHGGAEVHLCFVHGDQGGQPGEKTDRFHVVRVAVGNHDKVNVVRAKGQRCKTIRHVPEQMSMSRINEYFHIAVDQIGI